jgi:hypothetical protein
VNLKNGKQIDELKKWLIKHWGEPEKRELNQIKARLNRKFTDMAESMNQVDYTQDNYDRLFPNSKVSTPIGEVKLGGHQFEKLGNKRKHLLGAMHQTLTDPIAIINNDDKKTKLFSKTFKKVTQKIKAVISAVANIDGTEVSISTHEKDLNNIIGKIKKAADLVYEKPDQGRTAGNDSKNLAISGDTQLHINIPPSSSDVNE